MSDADVSRAPLPSMMLLQHSEWAFPPTLCCSAGESRMSHGSCSCSGLLLAAALHALNFKRQVSFPQAIYKEEPAGRGRSEAAALLQACLG